MGKAWSMPKRIVLFLLFLWAAVPLVRAQESPAGYEDAGILISTEELAKSADRPNVRIIDATMNAALFQRAHIPNAISIPHPTVADIKSRKETGFPITVEKAEEVFGGAGIDEKTLVVAYDDGDGPSASAMWFALQFFGHGQVKILDGGFRKWIAEGRPVTQAVIQPKPKKFTAKPDPEMVVTSNWILEHRKTPGTVILDARSLDEFIGKNKMSNPRGGHIPGARHLPWNDVAGKVETYKNAVELKKMFQEKGITKDKQLVMYCQIGMGRSTDLYVALRLLGFKNIKNYTGSWEDWSSNPTLEGEM